MIEININLTKSIENIKKLKEYFVQTKQKLLQISQDFGERMEMTKAKIADFKKNLDKREEYDV